MRADIIDHGILSSMRVLVWLFMFCLIPAALSTANAAALPVDVYLEIEGGVIGGAHVVPNGGTWTTGSLGSMTVGSTGAYSLRGPVSVDRVTYSGASTQALSMSDDEFMKVIYFNAKDYHAVFTYGGFINVGANRNYALLDAFYVIDYPFIVSPQVIVDDKCLNLVKNTIYDACINAEAMSGGTLHSAYIPIKTGKTYWFATKVDLNAGKVYLRMYDPDNNYALLSPGEVTVSTSAAGQKINLKMGRADAHTGNTNQGTKSYMDNIIIDWTNQLWPLIPSAGATVVKPMPPSNLQVY